MTSRISRRVYSCALATLMVAMIALPATSVFANDSVKVAFWNVRSGKGVSALAGHATPFFDTTNCTDPSQPLNAWGVGAMQAELHKALGDPSVVALGVTESWGNVCASPANIRQALGWKANTGEQNGVALIARYGFAGPEKWQQLDTTLNTSPNDTMWVVQAPVCLDAGCTQSMPVYVAHWYGTGANRETTFTRQALQTLAFIAATANGQPHVFGGDLNVFEGPAKVCNQSPNNTALPIVREAGYRDAWTTIHGAGEGYTGMANRSGCGYPQGYAWKRVDYVWTLPSLPPTDIRRFGMVSPGDASPSDHYGIVATFPNPFASAPAPAPTSAPAPAPDPAPAPAPAPTTEPVPTSSTPTASPWTYLVNTAASGATLQKIKGCGECFDAGAIGTQPVAAGGSFSFSVAAGHRLSVGLGSDTSAATSFAMDYAFSFWQNGAWEIREKGTYKKEGSFTATDRFKIALDGTTVKYYKNDALVYTSAVAATAPLVVDTSLNTIGASVTNLTPATTTVTTTTAVPAETGPVAVTWTAFVNAAVVGAELRKVSGCGECYNAGAVSTQTIGADGSFAFTVPRLDRLAAGLGYDTTMNGGFSIAHAFSFNEYGGFEVRENGVYRTEGSYAAGDQFTVAVVSGRVKYYRNGALVYTSAVAVSGPLVADTSFHTVGATLSNATIGQ